MLVPVISSGTCWWWSCSTGGTRLPSTSWTTDTISPAQTTPAAANTQVTYGQVLTVLQSMLWRSSQPCVYFFVFDGHYFQVCVCFNRTLKLHLSFAFEHHTTGLSAIHFIINMLTEQTSVFFAGHTVPLSVYVLFVLMSLLHVVLFEDLKLYMLLCHLTLLECCLFKQSSLLFVHFYTCKGGLCWGTLETGFKI